MPPVSWLTAAKGQPDGTAKRHHDRIMIRFEEVWPNIRAGRCKYRSYAS